MPGDLESIRPYRKRRRKFDVSRIPAGQLPAKQENEVFRAMMYAGPAAAAAYDKFLKDEFGANMVAEFVTPKGYILHLYTIDMVAHRQRTQGVVGNRNSYRVASVG